MSIRPLRRCSRAYQGSGRAGAEHRQPPRRERAVQDTRKALKQVPRLGPKAFEQCAGFLRITGGEDPLDASGVHPEAYPVVRRIIAATKSDIKALIGNAEILASGQAAELHR